MFMYPVHPSRPAAGREGHGKHIVTDTEVEYLGHLARNYSTYCVPFPANCPLPRLTSPYLTQAYT